MTIAVPLWLTVKAEALYLADRTSEAFETIKAAGSAILGTLVRRKLPESHLSDETQRPTNAKTGDIFGSWSDRRRNWSKLT